MKGKIGLGATVAVLLAVVSVTVASGTSSGGNGSSASDDRRSVVLHLIGKEVASNYLPLREGENTVGDEFHYASDLSRGGSKVGDDAGLCTLARVAPNGATTWHCVGTNELPGGQISAQGVVTYGPGEEVKQDAYFFSINGGTGKYRTARGEIKIKEGSEESRLTFRIVL